MGKIKIVVMFVMALAIACGCDEIGRASCRERV